MRVIHKRIPYHPPSIDIRSMILWLIFIILLSVFLFATYTLLKPHFQPSHSIPIVTTRILSSPNVIMDPYGPPLKNDGVYFPREASMDMNVATRPVLGVPINISTRGIQTDYTQLGILTRNKGETLILPLMGRKLLAGVDKWAYYTISNTGFLNTKLPITVNGRNCSGEYGCDAISSGDTVFVQGYEETFKATVYDNSRFSYIPYL